MDRFASWKTAVVGALATLSSAVFSNGQQVGPGALQELPCRPYYATINR